MVIGLRRVYESDWEYIRILRNHEDVRKHFHNPDIIEIDTHKQFMTEHNENYYIATHNGEAVGFIGCVDSDVRLAVDPEHQAKGLGRTMIELFLDISPVGMSGSFLAKIRYQNKASQKAFTAAGFNEITHLLSDTDSSMRRILTFQHLGRPDAKPI